MSIPIDVLRWAPPVVAALALIYSMITVFSALRAARRQSMDTARPAARRPMAILNLIGVLLAIGAAWALGLSVDWDLAPAMMLGGILVSVLFVLVYLSSVEFRPRADGTGTGHAHGLPSASGLLGASLGALAIGLPIAVRMYSGSTAVDVLLAGSLGLWACSAMLILGSSIITDTDTQSADAAVLRIGIMPTRMALLAGVSLAVAAAMGAFRFEKLAAGPILPFGMFAASVLFGALVNPVLQSGRPAVRWIGTIAFIAGTGVAAYLLATRSIGDIKAFYSFGVGLLTAFLVMLLAALRPPYSRIGAPFGGQLAVVQVLVVIASAVLAFRWMTGYGAALCGVGFAASFPALIPIANSQAARRGGQDSQSADPLHDAQVGSALAETVLVSTAFVVAVTLVRLFVEQMSMSKVGIDITAPYPLIGLAIGAAMPMLLRAALLSRPDRAAGADQPVSLTSAWIVTHTLGLWFAAVIAPLLVAFFWRVEATGAFLAGLAVSQLYIMLPLWLGEARGTADSDTRSAAVATQALALGSGIVAVLLSPRLIDITADLTRAAKIRALIVLLAVVFIWAFIEAFRRLRTNAGASAV